MVFNQVFSYILFDFPWAQMRCFFLGFNPQAVADLQKQMPQVHGLSRLDWVVVMSLVKGC